MLDVNGSGAGAAGPGPDAVQLRGALPRLWERAVRERRPFWGAAGRAALGGQPCVRAGELLPSEGPQEGNGEAGEGGGEQLAGGGCRGTAAGRGAGGARL